MINFTQNIRKQGNNNLSQSGCGTAEQQENPLAFTEIKKMYDDKVQQLTDLLEEIDPAIQSKLGTTSTLNSLYSTRSPDRTTTVSHTISQCPASSPSRSPYSSRTPTPKTLSLSDEELEEWCNTEPSEIISNDEFPESFSQPSDEGLGIEPTIATTARAKAPGKTEFLPLLAPELIGLAANSLVPALIDYLDIIPKKKESRHVLIIPRDRPIPKNPDINKKDSPAIKDHPEIKPLNQPKDPSQPENNPQSQPNDPSEPETDPQSQPKDPSQRQNPPPPGYYGGPYQPHNYGNPAGYPQGSYQTQYPYGYNQGPYQQQSPYYRPSNYPQQATNWTVPSGYWGSQPSNNANASAIARGGDANASAVARGGDANAEAISYPAGQRQSPYVTRSSPPPPSLQTRQLVNPSHPQGSFPPQTTPSRFPSTVPTSDREALNQRNESPEIVRIKGEVLKSLEDVNNQINVILDKLYLR